MWELLEFISYFCGAKFTNVFLRRGAGYDRDAARHRFPADGRRLHPPFPESQEVRPDGNLPTAGPVLPVQTAEPRHVPELQGLTVIPPFDRRSLRTLPPIQESVCVCVCVSGGRPGY